MLPASTQAILYTLYVILYTVLPASTQAKAQGLSMTVRQTRLVEQLERRSEKLANLGVETERISSKVCGHFILSTLYTLYSKVCGALVCLSACACACAYACGKCAYGMQDVCIRYVVCGTQ